LGYLTLWRLWLSSHGKKRTSGFISGFFHHKNSSTKLKNLSSTTKLEKQQMGINFMRYLLHQQQFVEPAKKVEIAIQQEDIECQLDQQDDSFNPFHPQRYSNSEPFCESALKESTTLNYYSIQSMVSKIVVNKAIGEEECEYKQL
jgi:hypothetical protein